MYTYGVEKCIADIMVQKNDREEEHPLAFHSQTLYDYQKRYYFIKKQVFTIINQEI